MIIARDRRQARVIKRFITGLLHEVPMLRGTVQAETQESIQADIALPRSNSQHEMKAMANEERRGISRKTGRTASGMGTFRAVVSRHRCEGVVEVYDRRYQETVWR
jgi:hypothetical protein